MDAQLAKMNKPFWRDGVELLKVAGSISGLLIVLVGGYLQITSDALTYKNDQLERRLEKAKSRLNYMSGFVSALKKNS